MPEIHAIPPTFYPPFASPRNQGWNNMENMLDILLIANLFDLLSIDFRLEKIIKRDPKF